MYLDVFIGGFRWGMTLGAGKAMLMRGGACATELCLMVGWVSVVVFIWRWLSCCGLWECVFRFLMLCACILCGLKLYGFGGGCVVFIEKGLLRAFLLLVCFWGSFGSG